MIDAKEIAHTVVDRPQVHNDRVRSVLAELADEIIALPEGKALLLPRDTLEHRLQVIRKYGNRREYTMHFKKLPDGYYAWATKTNGKL